MKQFLDETDPAESALLVSDIFSGSVNQTMLRCAQNRENVFVITGVTLSLLQELVLACDGNFTAEAASSEAARARRGNGLFRPPTLPWRAAMRKPVPPCWSGS